MPLKFWKVPRLLLVVIYGHKSFSSHEYFMHDPNPVPSMAEATFLRPEARPSIQHSNHYVTMTILSSQSHYWIKFDFEVHLILLYQYLSVWRLRPYFWGCGQGHLWLLHRPSQKMLLKSSSLRGQRTAGTGRTFHFIGFLTTGFTQFFKMFQ